MYFYHEGYDAYYTGTNLEDLSARDRREDDSTYELIQFPAIFNWLVIMSVALCIISTSIQRLS